MQITTPSGYIVDLKDKLNFGAIQQLKESLFEGAKVEIKDNYDKLPDVEVSNLLKYSYRAIPVLVTKVVKGEVVITQNIKEEIDNWDREDGEAVLEAINKVLANSKSKPNEEKKTV